jgi:hypothetical protein
MKQLTKIRQHIDQAINNLVQILNGSSQSPEITEAIVEHTIENELGEALEILKKYQRNLT